MASIQDHKPLFAGLHLAVTVGSAWRVRVAYNSSSSSLQLYS